MYVLAGRLGLLIVVTDFASSFVTSLLSQLPTKVTSLMHHFSGRMSVRISVIHPHTTGKSETQL